MQVDSKLKITDLMDFRPKKGDVGVEIEIESLSKKEFPGGRDYGLPTPWQATHDGSLRGNSIEYVFSSPKSKEDTHKAIDGLTKMLSDKGIVINPTIRAGVHVHINVQQLTTYEVMMFALTYYTLEEVLVDWCGKNRKGNLFCLRAKDAPGHISEIAPLFKLGFLGDLRSDNYRYAALNFTSIPKFGSLEFRSFPTEPSLDRIKVWVDILLQIREASKQFQSVEQFFEQFSMMGPREWANEMLGENIKHFNIVQEDERKIIDGMRIAQDFVFYGDY